MQREIQMRVLKHGKTYSSPKKGGGEHSNNTRGMPCLKPAGCGKALFKSEGFYTDTNGIRIQKARLLYSPPLLQSAKGGYLLLHFEASAFSRMHRDF
jgi:hypothetical protein